ncbi:MAG: protein kinase [Acidobacteria bacterium]|nr:protein kinase [Acidobacteriota bacterium]
MVGTSLGPYKILEPLGAGGMGEVYLGEDTHLGRKVAIKVLPAQFASDPERLARFEQEARAAAALNHPHIAAVFDVGTEGDTHFIVEEYLEGETLRHALDRGKLPLHQSLELATEFSEALAAAHDAGIVHRDLKPENVFVTREGHAKVLDFGLAKLTEVAAGDGSGDPATSQSPTTAQPAVVTSDGQLLGSTGYMSPEQAQGKPVDHRTDLFAFGCILFEMVTGGRCFAGRSAPETMSMIIHDEAPSLTDRDPSLPPQIQWILDKCLAKPPEERYQHTDDLVVRLKHLLRQVHSGAAGPAPPAAAGAPTVGPRSPVAWLVAGVVGVALGFLAAFFLLNVILGGAEEAGGIVRLSIPLDADGPIALGGQPPVAVAISPDGSQIVYVVNQAGENILYRRPLDDLQAQPIPGTEGGHGPFFSTDGEWLGFFADGKLKTVSLAGGAPVELAAPPTARGATVTADGRIIYTPTINSALWAVPVSGGDPQPLTQFDSEAGEFGHRWPHALPDGNSVLFVIDTGGSFDAARIALLSLDSGETRVLIEGGTRPVYSPTGHIVYGRQGTLLAVPFDLESGEVSGRPTVVLTDVATQPDTGAAHFALSDTGILSYIPGGARTNERVLVRVGLEGGIAPIAGLPVRAYQQPSLAPDGARLAVNIVEERHDIWIAELGRGALSRLTFRGDNHAPIWSPDGQKVAYGSERGGPLRLFWVAADGSGEEEELLAGENSLVPNSWSPDGRLLAYTEIHPSTRGDVWVLSLDGDRTTRQFLASEHDEREAAFSPDGSLLAYVSDEAGRYGVYVQPYPGPGRKLQISTGGGSQPVWSRDGKTLYYRSGDRMMAVRVDAETVSAEPPRELFEERLDEGYIYHPRVYDVAIDDSGFIAARAEWDSITRVNVILNWFEELKQRVPTGGQR